MKIKKSARAQQPANAIDYGPVYVTGGRFRGRVLYYDDDDTSRIAICYVGHPVDFVGSYNVPAKFLREPMIDDLLARSEEISGQLATIAINKFPGVRPIDVHALWSEKSLISDLLFERRLFGEMEHLPSEKTVFLYHSSIDKGFVRMVNDDLRRLGATTWIDENNIKVGDSLLEKINDGLETSKFLAVFLSPKSIKSQWAKREWQSFLSRQLNGSSVTVLPVLIEECEIPAVLVGLKYANFTESYQDGFKELRAAIAQVNGSAVVKRSQSRRKSTASA